MLKNWNIRRVLYLLGGIMFAMIAAKDGVWWMALFGLYFIAMSIFRFGCAAGTCNAKPFESEKMNQNSN